MFPLDEHAANQLSPEELAQAEETQKELLLDETVVRVLERRPRIEIPADFSARVAASVPPRPVVSVKASHVGYRAMWISIAVLTIGMFALAAGAGFGGHSQLTVGLELLMFAQLMGLAVWLGVRPALR